MAPLANLYFPETASLGRRYPEAPHPYRDEFQRDRDRIVHARAFRRLEDKTQVFTQGASDHFRNRLTHTIEVAQLARTVAQVLGLNSDFTEALALAHDIGHPPFAHAGEEELALQMRRFGETFDHNQHALRIVEYFEQRYARFPGLNLLFEVREGIVKHSRDLTPGDSAGLDEYLPHLRPPLEAQLIDHADEIAYNTADLDDAYSAGFFTLDELGHAVPEWAALFEEVETQFPGAGERVHFQETLRQLIDVLVSGLIEGTETAAQSAGVKTVKDVRHYIGRIAALAPAPAGIGRALKAFLGSRVYHSAPLREERARSVRMISSLFNFYLDNPAALPSPYKEQILERPAHRVICEYIAGMTDGYCNRTFADLGLTAA